MTQYAFYFDQSRCYSCHTCSVACKDWNGIEAGPEKWMTVYEWETGSYPDLRVHSLAFPCAHCENPACVKACETGALFKEDEFGAVLVDSSKCNGCRKCYRACPFGAPKFASDAPGTKMSKCDMCVDKLKEGKAPVCVAACPLRAFDFGPIDEIIEKYGNERQFEGMPSTKGTQPCFIVKSAAEHKKLISYDSARALELMQARGDLGTVFESIEEVVKVDEGKVDRGTLCMKHENNAALLSQTVNNMG